MKIYYIASETQDTLSNSERWNSFDKRLILKKCWLSFITTLSQEDSVEVFYNNVKPETIDWMSSSCNSLINFTKSESLKENFNNLLQQLQKDVDKEENKDEICFIVEDDYLWLPGSLSEIKKAFTKWNSFIVPNDTILNFKKPMFSKVLLGTDRYWKTSNIVGWTLAGKASSWKKHISIVEEAFSSVNLQQYNRLTQEDYCINPMPAYAAHLRNYDLSPYVDWSELWEKIKI